MSLFLIIMIVLFVLSGIVLGILALLRRIHWGFSVAAFIVAVLIFVIGLIGASSGYQKLVDSMFAPAVTADCEVPAKIIVTNLNKLVKIDLRSGDNLMFNVVVVDANDMDGANPVVVVTVPGKSMDITHASMTYSSYMLGADSKPEEVQCFVAKLVSEMNLKSPFMVWVDSDPTYAPAGYDTLIKVATRSGIWWDELTDRTYAVDQPDSGIALPEGFNTFTEKRQFCSKPGEFNHGQTWDGNSSGVVVDYEVEAGFCLTIPFGMQGTNFSYTTFDPAQIAETVRTATVNHVSQDEIVSSRLVLVHCGAPANLPAPFSATWSPKADPNLTKTTSVGWRMDVGGWTCEPLK